MTSNGQQRGDWVRAVSVAELPEGGSKLFRYYDKRIAIFRTGRGIYAVDNRCPHQGYALLQGDVKNDVLTCAWHNWKFDLTQDGLCTYGGESVRSYPVDVRNGEVWLDVTDPAAEVLAPQLFASLREAMGDVDIGRLARDTTRLQRIGTPLVEVVREGVNFGAPRAEYGWNHSLATLTDCLNLASMFEGTIGSLPVVQGMSVISETQVRRPLRPRPDPVDPVTAYGSIAEALAAYPALVDDERIEEAEGLLRGLIAAEAAPSAIRHAMATAITDHFLGYGHPLIYLQKSFELLDRIGWSEADTVLGPLVPNTGLSTRYDKLLYMRKFLRAWKEAELDLSDLLGRQAEAPFDGARFRRTVLDEGPEASFAALRSALEAGVNITKIIDATSLAAAERFRRFDIDLDSDDTNEWGWLDVTHTMTYLDALRWTWAVDPTPEVLRGLFHAVWFVQWTQRFDSRDQASDPPPFATTDANEVLHAIRRRDPEGAMATINGFEGPQEELDGALAQVASEDHSVAPIMVAHSVKTARASIVEAEVLGDRAPMVAAGRFLASPKRERFVYNATLEAIDFVQGRARDEDEE